MDFSILQTMIHCMRKASAILKNFGGVRQRSFLHGQQCSIKLMDVQKKTEVLLGLLVVS